MLKQVEAEAMILTRKEGKAVTAANPRLLSFLSPPSRRVIRHEDRKAKGNSNDRRNGFLHDAVLRAADGAKPEGRPGTVPGASSPGGSGEGLGRAPGAFARSRLSTPSGNAARAARACQEFSALLPGTSQNRSGMRFCLISSGVPVHSGPSQEIFLSPDRVQTGL